MTTFKEHGYNLEFPAEWELEFDEETLHEITLHSPNGAFWALTRRPAFVKPDDLLQEALKALTKEYAEAEISTAFEEYSNRRLDGFNLGFFYLDLPCMAMIRTIRFGTFTYFLYIQTMDQSTAMMDELNEITRYWVENLEIMEYEAVPFAGFSVSEGPEDDEDEDDEECDCGHHHGHDCDCGHHHGHDCDCGHHSQD